VKSQLADFLTLIYPRVCIHCSKPLSRAEEFLCLSCELSLPKSTYLTNKDQLCKKFAFQPKVIAAFAYLDFNKFGIAQKLVHSLKYQGKKDLGIWLGSKFGKELAIIEHVSYDVLIPSPLHPNRLRQRGYNQSTYIAQGLSNALSVPVVENLVERTRETTTQTKKSKLKRWENMEAVFEVVRPEEIGGRNLLLVDDVITSGATIGMLCDALAKENPASITVAALAAGK
jgi:ComF family protein